MPTEMDGFVGSLLAAKVHRYARQLVGFAAPVGL